MVEELYQRYLTLTGEPQAAAMLVLAHSNLEGRQPSRLEWLTVPEAAERLKVNEKRVYEMVREKRIPSVRAGRGNIRILASDLGSIEPPRSPAAEPEHAYVPTHLPPPTRRRRGRPKTVLPVSMPA